MTTAIRRHHVPLLLGALAVTAAATVLSGVGGGATSAEAATAPGAPTLRSVTPARATIYGGQTLTLLGAGFSRSAKVSFDLVAPGEGNVAGPEFGATQTPLSVTATRIVVLAPPTPFPGKGTVMVTQGSGDSTSLAFGVVLAPGLPAITLVAAARTATHGAGVILTGRLTAVGGAPVAERDVVVTVTVGRGTRTLGTVTTGDDGRFMLTQSQVAPVAVYAATASFGGEDSGRGAALSRARAIVRL